jgi:hypothetical protein
MALESYENKKIIKIRGGEESVIEYFLKYDLITSVKI